MANVDGTSWDEGVPVISDPRRGGALEINSLRKGTSVRANKEHATYAAASVGGEHKAGSAKCYYQSAAPTLRPDGTTSLDTNDKGRLWFDTDTGVIKQWDGAAWSDIQIAATVAPTLASFYKEGSGSTLPVTQSGLNAGTWLVFAHGLSTAAGNNDAYTYSVTINGVTKTYNMNAHPGGTVPLVFMFNVIVSGAGTISLTAQTNMARITALAGFQLSP